MQFEMHATLRYVRRMCNCCLYSTWCRLAWEVLFPNGLILEETMGNWWNKLTNLFGAMACAEAGDFDTVRDLLAERQESEGGEAKTWGEHQEWGREQARPETD